MASSSQHIRKRQYQPSNQTTLNSYFNRDGSSQSSRSPMSPPLDADTQSSLISVGMRVRKSVPEGYKTHKTLGQQEYPFPSTAPPMSSAPARPSMSPMRSNELQPFMYSGLHKTGGWSVQPPSSAPSVMRGQQDDDEDMPGLSTSQNTIMSTQNSFASYMESRKRTLEDEYEDDAEDSMDALFAEQDATDTAVTGRPMARMKNSTRKMGQNKGIQIFGSDDFEEAPFLMPMQMD